MSTPPVRPAPTMQHALEFDETGCLTVTTGGRAERAGFFRLIRETVDDPRFRPGADVLVDHTRLDMTPLGTEDVQAIADEVLRLDARIGDGRVAIVAPAAVAYGLSRQFAAFADLARLRVRVFTERGQALAWLRSPQPGARARGTLRL